MKSIITNKGYYYFLVGIILILLSVNLINIIRYQQISTLIPMIIQLTILYLIFSNSQYCKLGVKLWSGIFLIFGSGLKLLGIFLEMSFKEGSNLETIIWQFLILIIGVSIFIMTEKNIEVIKK